MKVATSGKRGHNQLLNWQTIREMGAKWHNSARMSELAAIRKALKMHKSVTVLRPNLDEVSIGPGFPND